MIELLIAVSIISLLIPSLFAVLVISFRSQIKNIVVNQLKRDGDYAMRSMIDSIRTQTKGLTKVCSGTADTDMLENNIKFVDYFNTEISYIFNVKQYKDVDSIASSSQTIGDIFLTSDNVNVSKFRITCRSALMSKQTYITITFKLTSKIDPDMSLSYRNSIALRNY